MGQHFPHMDGRSGLLVQAGESSRTMTSDASKLPAKTSLTSVPNALNEICLILKSPILGIVAAPQPQEAQQTQHTLQQPRPKAIPLEAHAPLCQQQANFLAIALVQRAAAGLLLAKAAGLTSHTIGDQLYGHLACNKWDIRPLMLDPGRG